MLALYVILGETDRVRSDDDDDDYHDNDDDDDDDDLVVVVDLAFLSFVLLWLVFLSMFYGRIIIASIQFCDPSISNDINFAFSYLPVTPYHETPPIHPFYCPPTFEKCGFYT